MFCTICAPQIEREIAMCCWRLSVINLVSKWGDGEKESENDSLLFTELFSYIVSSYKFEK